MNFTGVVILTCWIILLLYWTICAFFQKETKEKPTLKSRMFYSLVLLVSYLLLLFSYKFSFLNYILIRTSLAINVVSIFLALGGLIICLYSRKVLGSNWSREVLLKKNHELITVGPYRYIRHPIYSGLLMLFLGTALAIGNLGSIIGFILLFFNFKQKYLDEEALMIRHFKKRYLRYMKKTRALIPFVY
jgi:protein-S-isoprenylcysteine O-methyltransferase Ste14